MSWRGRRGGWHGQGGGWHGRRDGRDAKRYRREEPEPAPPARTPEDEAAFQLKTLVLRLGDFHARKASAARVCVPLVLL